MSESSKYPINGICRFEDFREQVVSNDYTVIPIDRMCDIDWWRVSLDTDIKDGITYVYPYLRPCGFKQIAIHCFFMFLNTDESKNSPSKFLTYSKYGQRSCGSEIAIDTLLDESNGWLSNGTISIEYGFRVEAVQYLDGNWECNFYDKHIDYDQREDVIEFQVYMPFDDEWLYLYTPRELVNFHSRLFTTKTYTVPERFSEYYWQAIPEILQIVHGANIKNYYFGSLHLKIAKELEFQNVIMFCERQIIQESLDANVYLVQEFQKASNYNLNHYLAHLMKNVRNVKRLTDVLKTMRLKEMSTEFMKQCTKYFFENA